MALGQFFANQSSGPSLPNPATLPQTSPHQTNRPQPPQHSPPLAQTHQTQGPSFPLPTLNASMQQQHSPQAVAPIDREREREHEREREQQRQQEILRQRLREQEIIAEQQYEMEMQEQHHLEQRHSPQENHTGSIPLQQPVASRVPATLHGPNGILNDQHLGAGPQNPQSAALGAPAGPGSFFSNGVQTGNENTVRPLLQQPAQPIPPQHLLSFGNGMATQQIPANISALSQGQQPILNVSISFTCTAYF